MSGILSTAALGATLHVPSEYPTIQAGINAASDGDTVMVSDGTYSGDGNRNLRFLGKKITLVSANGPESCVIDCTPVPGSNSFGFRFDNSEDQNSVLSGFTICNAYYLSENFWTNGAGIICDQSSPVIVNCIVRDCFSDDVGAGMFFYLSRATVNRCTILNNLSEAANGGGISLARSDVVFTNCRIHGNTGGGFQAVESDPTMVNCIVSENSTYHVGAGFNLINAYPTIINCTIVGNDADLHGGAVYCAASYPLFYNCIFWDNSPDDLKTGTGQPSVRYSCVNGGYPGIGNISGDPLFSDIAGTDFHLTQYSPCIDAGTDRTPLDKDYDGLPRNQGGCVDMGAFENQEWAGYTRTNIMMPSHTILPGDTVNCIAYVNNQSSSELAKHHLFVILDLNGALFFAPSFSQYDHYTQTFLPGISDVTVLDEFKWPAGVGAMNGVIWYCAILNPDSTRIVGEISVYDFGWTE